MAAKLDTTRELARFIADTGYDDLPGEVVAAARMCLMDWLGVALRGSKEPVVDILADVARQTGGARQSTVLGKRLKTSAMNAATINGAMGHVLDYDDIYDPAHVHASTVLFPATLSVAEWKQMCGRDIVTAYVLGYEVMGRLGRQSGLTLLDKRQLHTTAVLGPFGAAAAAGKLSGLTAEQLVYALGTASVQAAGTVHAFGSMCKSFQVGKSASNGVLSALLAGRGFTSGLDVFEAPKGFFEVYVQEGDLAKVTEGLGKSWCVTGTYFKAHASCGATHASIDGALEIRGRHRPPLEDIAAIHCQVWPTALKVAAKPEPEKGLEGKFSIPYCVAVALAEGGARDDKFTDDRVNDPRLVDLRRKVRLTAGEGFDLVQAAVTVTMKDGSTYRANVDCMKGAPGNPLTLEEVRDKFRAVAGSVLSADKVRRAEGLIGDLEKLGDVGELMELCR